MNRNNKSTTRLGGQEEEGVCQADPFARRSCLASTPPATPVRAPQPTAPCREIGEKETPKRLRDPASPTDKPRSTPPKKSKANTQEIEEIGSILDELLFMYHGKQPAMRHINLATKSMLARLKELQEVVKAQLTENLRMRCSEESHKQMSHAEESAGSNSKCDTATQTEESGAGSKPPTAAQKPTNEATEKNPSNSKPAPTRKQQRSQPAEGKTEVKGKLTRRKQPNRPDAILIKCTESMPYADVLKMVKTAPALQALKNNVQGIRKSAAGELILRLQKPSHPATDQLHVAISSALAGKAAVRTLQETVQMEVLDIDESTTADEVLTALFASVEGDIPVEATPTMRAAYGGTQIASLALQPSLATKLLETGKVRIGCKSQHPVGKETCFKCAGTGHKSGQCTHEAKCILCTRMGTGTNQAAHSTLSRNCPEAAQDLLAQTTRETRIDVAIISEPYTPKHIGVWHESLDAGAALWSCGQAPYQLTQRMARKGFARAKCGRIYVYSCYIPPSIPLAEYTAIIEDIAQDAHGKSPVIIAGDFNAWATEWGSSRTTPRGTILLDIFASLNVCLLNIGTRSTYSKAGRESLIELTFASPDVARDAKWHVSDVYTHSDHFAVITDTSQLGSRGASRRLQHTGYKMDTMDLERLLPMGGNTHRPIAWWNEDIAKARKECLAARRKSQRSRPFPNSEHHLQNFRAKRKLLNKAIRRSKSRYFQELCDAADAEPFGLAYKLVMGRLCRQPMPTNPEQLKQIVLTLFPRQTPGIAPQLPANGINDRAPTDDNEVLSIAAKLKADKSPGPDGIPNGVIKAVITAQPRSFVELYNQCIAECTVPCRWKLQRLVLIPKPGKELDDPSSYRPLCMLDTMGKIFERIICNRLECKLAEVRGLSERQFGFRKHRSTTDAIRAVAELAEDAIQGTSLVCTLDDRVLNYDTEDGQRQYRVTGGVPQGSVLGPLLWNVMYDGVLHLCLPEGNTIIGFADDIAVVTVAKNLDEVTLRSSAASDRIIDWLSQNGLTLAEQKSEAVLISSRKIVETTSLRVGSAIIKSKPAIKYLGVMIDHRLSYKQHLEYISHKAASVTTAISRILANTKGPRQRSRRLIAGVVTSTILYGSNIYAPAMEVASYSRGCNAAYRRCALRVATCFRTVSEDAALVLAGMIPLGLMAAERQGGATTNRQLRDNTIEQWQSKWDASSSGRWTHGLIPNLKLWIQRRHGDVDHYLAQIFTGHGCFKAYLHRFNHKDDPFCEHCGHGVIEDAEHALFYCPLYRRERDKATAGRNDLSPENLVARMVETENGWTAVANMPSAIMKELRRQERIRRGID
ncbi:uncharacterized protein [Drosophila virilis]|uniref:uncharacterized protein n=1 Tax=Drosophila virilis TaxID=7244 RepID=UPI0038B40CFC